MDDDEPIARPVPTLAYRVRRPPRPASTLLQLVGPAAFVAFFVAAIVAAWVGGLFLALLHLS